MLTVLYEDRDIIVVEKPVGMESQVSGGFAPDMVSEIKKHINRLCPTGQEPYVGVIHRLDKPVGGVMVYAKTKKAAAALSKQVQANEMHKKYNAVVCGKPVDNVGNFVDYLLKDNSKNMSKLVEKGITGAKRAELSYIVRGILENDPILPPTGKPDVDNSEGSDSTPLTLVEVELHTGRHHQIRVQFAGHGTPLWGDNRYNPIFNTNSSGKRYNIALFASQLTFRHPETGKSMTFTAKPKGEIFQYFLKSST
ncbi:MAG: RluA family pseudouridine synthase [Hungatella hathewayi]|nr:RluA family pseudouridine synthase [Hungatella hathewayi]